MKNLFCDYSIAQATLFVNTFFIKKIAFLSDFFFKPLDHFTTCFLDSYFCKM